MLNNLNIVGRLTKDPETKTAKETTITNFVVAVDNTRKTKDGNKKTTFVQCNAFGGLAEAVQKYFKKGELIGVSGELEQDTYTTDKGETRYTYRLIVEHIAFCESKKAEEAPKEDNQPKFDQYTGKPLENK